MKWKNPPKIKIFEALGSLADGRMEMINGQEAKVFSSSGNKFYDVKYSPEDNAITVNDNGSYWVGYLGYPAIVFLMEKGIVEYDKNIAQAFKGFKWKDINQKFKNDFTKTEKYIMEEISKRGYVIQEIIDQIDNIYDQLVSLGLDKLGTTAKPPKGY